MTEHFLKTWPKQFMQVANGLKPFEIRKNDRGFDVGDVLILQHYEPSAGAYNGLEIRCQVTSILHGLPCDDPAHWGLVDGYCAMGLRHLTPITFNPLIAACPAEVVINYGLCN